ncbi:MULTISPECIES: hypothetical protein [Lactobacillaceae]|uniref:hypothetical protein n=1 Tax=Lactobacillaceae TaxID=33958 RepID=UPI000704B61B|nr:hypothetical protein [Secundilactobacillus collinoides]
MKKIMFKSFLLVILACIMGVFNEVQLTYAATGYTSKTSVFGRLKYSTTIPKYIRGTYYEYNGHKKWSKLKINKDSISSGSDHLTNLAFAYLTKSHQIFTFNAKAHCNAEVAFGENGLRMSFVNYRGHKIKAIKCYQNQGFEYWLVSKKIEHSFQKETWKFTS